MSLSFSGPVIGLVIPGWFMTHASAKAASEQCFSLASGSMASTMS